MKIIKSLEKSELLIKRFSETIKNKAKEQTRDFLETFLATLVASLLGTVLTNQ